MRISKGLCAPPSPYSTKSKQNTSIFSVPICFIFNSNDAIAIHSDQVVYDVDAYCQYLSVNAVNGVLVNGTTGEGTCLSVDERKKTAEAWQKVKTTAEQIFYCIFITKTNQKKK